MAEEEKTDRQIANKRKAAQEARSERSRIAGSSRLTSAPTLFPEPDIDYTQTEISRRWLVKIKQPTDKTLKTPAKEEPKALERTVKTPEQLLAEQKTLEAKRAKWVEDAQTPGTFEYNFVTLIVSHPEFPNPLTASEVARLTKLDSQDTASLSESIAETTKPGSGKTHQNHTTSRLLLIKAAYYTHMAKSLQIPPNKK